MILKESSQNAVINVTENMLQKSVPLEGLRMTKVMQKFQKTGLANASSTRPVILNNAIPNTFKLISTQAYA